MTGPSGTKRMFVSNAKMNREGHGSRVGPIDINDPLDYPNRSVVGSYVYDALLLQASKLKYSQPGVRSATIHCARADSTKNVLYSSRWSNRDSRRA